MSTVSVPAFWETDREKVIIGKAVVNLTQGTAVIHVTDPRLKDLLSVGATDDDSPVLVEVSLGWRQVQGGKPHLEMTMEMLEESK